MWAPRGSGSEVPKPLGSNVGATDPRQKRVFPRGPHPCLHPPKILARAGPCGTAVQASAPCGLPSPEILAPECFGKPSKRDRVGWKNPVSQEGPRMVLTCGLGVKPRSVRARVGQLPRGPRTWGQLFQVV